ncbi:MAG: 2-amino-4-hydroxy-6-hydroxymethyldihydropteridine diphosphokinase [Flavobacteriales bacterium]|nr:2-amino-4-hydroxy-6-hydroxymethyldihydropteridine diphosphokinase [Flavobacteriales bacterium]MBL6869880.1 2-amino-4-hydroxy-6-hydroxymethyldihydropteridine diphosphokinase [Flavobacteriales bacterium]
MQENEVVISLGTNLGDKLKNLKNALSNIESFGRIFNKSRIFSSDPWGYDSENEFLNMGLVIKTSLEPMQLLKKLKSIEKQMGRGPKMGQSYQDRIIDLDILIYSGIIIDNEELSIPHPKIKERKFSLLILKDLFENEFIPDLNDFPDKMLLKCIDESNVVLFNEK